MAHTLNLNDGTSHIIFSDRLDKRQDAFARILCETLGREAESMFWALTLEKDNYTTFELKNAKETISNLEDIINDQTETIHRQTYKQEDIEAKLQDANETIDDLRTDLDKRDAIIKELETKLHALETLIADLQAVLEHIPDMNGKPEEQMQRLQNIFDDTGSIIEKLKNII